MRKPFWRTIFLGWTHSIKSRSAPFTKFIILRSSSSYAYIGLPEDSAVPEGSEKHKKLWTYFLREAPHLLELFGEPKECPPILVENSPKGWYSRPDGVILCKENGNEVMVFIDPETDYRRVLKKVGEYSFQNMRAQKVDRFPELKLTLLVIDKTEHVKENVSVLEEWTDKCAEMPSFSIRIILRPKEKERMGSNENGKTSLDPFFR